MAAHPELTPEAQRAIEVHVRSLLGTWLKWIGVANLATLLGLIAYVVFELPDVAAERLVPGMSRRVDNLTTDLEKKLGEAFVLSGRVQASYDALNKRSADLAVDVKRVESELKAAEGSNLGELAKTVAALGNSKDLPALVQRIEKLEQQASTLGKARTGATFTVTNPVMGNGVANCPPGTFVSSITAPKGVGGRYAVDGISALKVECSPL